MLSSRRQACPHSPPWLDKDPYHPRAGPFHRVIALPKYCSPFIPLPLSANLSVLFIPYLGLAELTSALQPHLSCSGGSPPPPCFNLHPHPSSNHLFEQFNGHLIKYCISEALCDGIIPLGILRGMHTTVAQHCLWLSLCVWAASPAAAPSQEERNTALHPTQRLLPEQRQRWAQGSRRHSQR